MKFYVFPAAGLVAIPFLAGAQDKSDRLKFVNRLDVERNIVRRTALWKCQDDVVSDARAQEIKASRIQRAKGKLKPAKALFSDLRMRGSGSSFFVSRDGHFLTNHHVIDGCTQVSVKPSSAGYCDRRQQNR
jgi:S1-C subfamily serine protease